MCLWYQGQPIPQHTLRCKTLFCVGTCPGEASGKREFFPPACPILCFVFSGRAINNTLLLGSNSGCWEEVLSLRPGKKQGRGGQRGWEERSAPSARSWRIAGIPGVLPWLCRDGAACASTQGRSVTQRLAVRCPVTLAMLLEKTRRGTGMQGGRAAEKLLWGEGGSWRGSCGWWEQWGKAVPLHKLSLVSTKLPWPKRGGGSRGRRGAGGVCNQVMDGLG